MTAPAKLEREKYFLIHLTPLWVCLDLNLSVPDVSQHLQPTTCISRKSGKNPVVLPIPTTLESIIETPK